MVVGGGRAQQACASTSHTAVCQSIQPATGLLPLLVLYTLFVQQDPCGKDIWLGAKHHSLSKRLLACKP